jgi:hypothetical protein
MRGEFGYFINRYWIAEYIQYLQDLEVVLVYTTRAEGTTIPLSTTPCSPDGLSYENALLWDKGKLEPQKWLSHGTPFSSKGYDVLKWMMRWVDPVC